MININCITIQEFSGQLDCFYKKYRFINCKLNNYNNKESVKIISIFGMSAVSNSKTKIETATARDGILRPSKFEKLTFRNYPKYISDGFLLYLIKYGFDPLN